MWALPLVLLAAVAAAEADDWAALRLWDTPAVFSVDSGGLLSGAAKGDGGPEVGWRVRSRLHVSTAWSDPDDPHDLLLRMRLEETELEERSRTGWSAAGAAWDGEGGEGGEGGDTWLVRWSRGLVTALHAPPAPVPLQDFRRALTSLFQFRLSSGEWNETDASGACWTRHAGRAGRTLRKYKRSCEWRGHVSGQLLPDLPSLRQQRVTLGAEGGVEELVSDEEHGAGAEGAGLRLRAWLRLRHVGASAPGPRASSPAAACAGLAPAGLPLEGTDEPLSEEEIAEALRELVEALRGSEEAGAGGEERAAAALADAVPALRAARPDTLRDLLSTAEQQDMLPAVSEALALAGCARAHRAAAAVLRLADVTPHPAAAPYLLALARALQPEEVSADVVRLAERARDPDVRCAALLAACVLRPAAASLAERHLARCGAAPCRLCAARALAAAPPDPGLLLALAERAAPAHVHPPLHALLQLAERDPARLLPPHLRRLERLLLALDAPVPLDARALALDALLTASSAHAHRAAAALLPVPLAEISRALAATSQHELLRYLWQRCAERGGAAARHAREAQRLLPDPLQRAPPGGSSVLRREAGAVAGWAAAIDSAQLAARGALRAGTVRVLAAPTAGGPGGVDELFALHVWAQGLDALAGGGEEEEEPAAGLEVRAGGVWAGAVPLFRGRAGLAAALWAGAGSSPTPVSRAGWARGGRVRAALLAGRAVRLEAWCAGRTSLDAQGSVSLWARTAAGGAELRAGGAALARVRVGGAGRVRGAARGGARPALRLQADADFYSTPTLCVRAQLTDYEWTRSLTLQSARGARGWRSSQREEARSLALGADNHRACAALPPSDVL